MSSFLYSLPPMVSSQHQPVHTQSMSQQMYQPRENHLGYSSQQYTPASPSYAPYTPQSPYSSPMTPYPGGVVYAPPSSMNSVPSATTNSGTATLVNNASSATSPAIPMVPSPPPSNAFVPPVPLTLATLPSLSAAGQKFFGSPVFMPQTTAPVHSSPLPGMPQRASYVPSQPAMQSPAQSNRASYNSAALHAQAALMGGWIATLVGASNNANPGASNNNTSPGGHRRASSTSSRNTIDRTPSVTLTPRTSRMTMKQQSPTHRGMSGGTPLSPLQRSSSSPPQSPRNATQHQQQPNVQRLPSMTLDSLANQHGSPSLSSTANMASPVPQTHPQANRLNSLLAAAQNSPVLQPQPPPSSGSPPHNAVARSLSTLGNSPPGSPKLNSSSGGSPKFQPAPPGSPPNNPAPPTASAVAQGGRSRKSLSMHKPPDPHANMKSAYLSVGGNSNVKHKSTPTSRRASITAAESLAAGLPPGLVSTLHSVGLGSPYFTNPSSSPSLSPSPSIASTTVTGSPQRQSWNGSSSNTDGSSSLPMSMNSSRRASVPEDIEAAAAANAAATAANANQSPKQSPVTHSPPQKDRQLFPWSLLAREGTTDSTVWKDGLLQRQKSGLSLTAEDDPFVASATKPPSLLSRLPSAPTVAHSDGSGSGKRASGGAGTAALQVPATVQAPKRRLSFMITDPDNVARALGEGGKDQTKGNSSKRSSGGESKRSTGSSDGASTSTTKLASSIPSALAKEPEKELSEEERMARAISNAMFAAALEGEPGAGGGSKRGSGTFRRAPSTTNSSGSGSSPADSPIATTRKIARIKLRRSLTAVGAIAAQAQAAALKEKERLEKSDSARNSGHTAQSTPTGDRTPSPSARVDTGSTQGLLGLQNLSSLLSSSASSRSGSSSPLPPSASTAESGSDGIIYITREEAPDKNKQKVFIIDSGKIAREKAERAAADKARFERQAERDRKKIEEQAEKKKQAEEQAAAKEASRLARERMTNLLAEQAKQKRMAEKLAEEERALAEAIAAGNGPGSESTASIRARKSAAASALARQKEAEAEARKKAAREMHPDYDAEEAGDSIGEVGVKEPEEGEDATPSTEDQPKAAAAPKRHARTASRSTLNTAGLSSLLAKPTPRQPKQVKKLITPRMVNAAKKGDLDDLKKILIEEFGSLKAPADKLNKSGESHADFLNRIDKNGSCALHHAVWPGHVEFMSLLLAQGANVNLQNNRKNCVMHLAVERGHEEVIRLLLRHGADPLLINSNHHAPFQVVPSVKEQLQWAGFLYLTLEAIWKHANPNWIPEVERDIVVESDPPPESVDSDAVRDAAASPVPGSGMATPPIQNGSGASTPAVAGASSPTTAPQADDPAGATTPLTIDSSHDHSPLAPLNPLTPQWLSELSILFQKKDANRVHIKHVQSKLQSVMRMGLLKGLASGGGSPLTKPSPPEGSLSPPQSGMLRSISPPGIGFLNDLPPAPSSARSTLAQSGAVGLGSGKGAGLASLLRKMKIGGGKGSTGKGGGSGKNSQRSSIEVGQTTPPVATRRSSQEGAKVKLASTTPAAANNSTLNAPSVAASPTGSRSITPAPGATAPVLFKVDAAPASVDSAPVPLVKTASIFSASVADIEPEVKKPSLWWPFQKK